MSVVQHRPLVFVTHLELETLKLAFKVLSRPFPPVTGLVNLSFYNCLGKVPAPITKAIKACELFIRIWKFMSLNGREK